MVNINQAPDMLSWYVAAGGMIGGFFATNIGSTQPFGIEGWRFAFHLMAAVSLVTSALVFYLATEPRPTAKVSLHAWHSQGKQAECK